MKGSLGLIAFTAMMAQAPETAQAQVDFEPRTNYTFEEPVVFNEWCQQMKDMFGDTCVCETKIGTSNGIDALDLDHLVTCDPTQGRLTCVENVTVETANVYLKANSIGEIGNYENIQQTVINDFYVFLDDTSIDTISFRYNANFKQRRSGCEAVFGGVNCARCGLCDLPPDDREDGIHVHLSPNDIFNGISGQCRYGSGPDVGLFNTCEDGDNILTNIVWRNLEVRSEEEFGACPADVEINEVTDPAATAASSAATTALVVAASLVPSIALLVL